jgi:acyl-CoA reductase-like NAD-dependent aldehyde dehydrogenase
VAETVSQNLLQFAAAISRANVVVIVPSESYPLPALDMYQIFDTSDLPGNFHSECYGK